MPSPSLPSPAADQAPGSLPPGLLWAAVACTLAAVSISAWSILRHLYSYQRPVLQRLVIRIMLMIPIYAVASLASLWSLRAAFFIDVVRDLYEAFVIYTFFTLLLLYLGGPRSLLTLLHSSLRPPTPHPFPLSLILHDLDLSDPHSYLALKRGVLQYCVVKPVLAAVTVGLKLGDVYDEGRISVGNGYTWVSAVYNASICLSLYCLAMFWVTIHADVRPFRPTPKFLCVKGILFFSFWQAIGVSLLVKWGAVKAVGSFTDEEHISLALNNILISFEMPAFAIAHTYAFCVLSDYVDPALSYTARLPLSLAARDAFGYLDLYYDVRSTIRGKGISYRSFEPSGNEWGVVRAGPGRERRLRDGLRYVGGGREGRKYWLPVGRGEEDVLKVATVGAGPGGYGATGGGTLSPPGFGVVRNGHGPHSIGYRSPPLNGASASASSAAPAYFPSTAAAAAAAVLDDSDDDGGSVSSLDFSPSPAADAAQEALYTEARAFLHGDWNYVVVDVSKEVAKRRMREQEENVLRGLGRRGEGRVRGERWGRGNADGREAVGKGRKGGVYGAYHARGEDEGPYKDDPTPSSSASHTSPHSSSSSPPSAPSPSSSSSSSSSTSTPAHAGPIREQWPVPPSSSSAAAAKGKQVAQGLRKVASKVVPPPPALRFSTDERVRTTDDGGGGDGGGGGKRGGLSPGQSRGGSRPSSPGTGQGELPPDAVDLVVADEDAWEKEQERRRRKGEPGRHAPDEGLYRRAQAQSVAGSAPEPVAKAAAAAGLGEGRNGAGAGGLSPSSAHPPPEQEQEQASTTPVYSPAPMFHGAQDEEDNPWH